MYFPVLSTKESKSTDTANDDTVPRAGFLMTFFNKRNTDSLE